MKIGVVGAGVTGLVAAYELARAGHECDVYERWPGLGGQAATLDVGGGVLLERYYHHLFMSDHHIVELYEELGMPDAIDWRVSKVATFAAGKSYPFTSPVHLLRFKPLSPIARLRLGASILWLQKRAFTVHEFEHITAREWIRRHMGEEVWATLWGPLLKAKFNSRADDLSMAWLWRKLTLRREIKGAQTRQEFLGYPRDSWEPLYRRLQRAIEQAGGRVMIDRPAARLAHDGEAPLIFPGAPQSFRRGLDPRAFDADSEPQRYDGVIATVPSDLFLRLIDDGVEDKLGEGYIGLLRAAEYQTALVLLLELDRSFSPYYWTNIADPALPFIGLIEQSNLVGDAYAGRRFLYVSNYVEAGDPLLALDADQLIERYTPGLKQVNPSFSRDWIRQRWLFREPAAQPVVTLGYERRIPPLDAGLPGLVLANTTQIYPEDRGTNYSVRLGREAAAVLSAKLARAESSSAPRAS